ncbi:MAG: SpoIVB peptidase S55 domain-containing protein, partial [Thermoanaerobaculia bacterium]
MNGTRVPVRTIVQKNRRVPATLFAMLFVFAAVAAHAETMPVSAVKKGMKGYGVTVFDGTTPEKFDVEILGVLNNIGPGQDLILAKIDSPVVRRTGVIAGMSGSPIYIDGKVIGALAYAWQFAKEPVAGITPIDEMLKIARNGGTTNALVAEAMPRFSGAELLNALANNKTDEIFEKLVSGFGGKTMSGMSGAKPIAVPVSLSSFAPETISRFGKYLDDMGFVAVPSGATSTSTAAAPAADRSFKPGDPIGAVLLNGDFTVAATGTVTHVDGDRVYAFGHPFLDMGEISFPMAKSEIVTVLPSLASSFKFSNTGAIVGEFRQDRSTGIMGVLGGQARTIPVELTVDGSGPSQTYHVNVVRHTQLSPLILAMAVD